MDKNKATKTARRRKRKSKRGPWLLVFMMTGLFLLLSIGGCSALYVAGNQMIDEKKLDLMETSTVYAADGKEMIAKLAPSENREKVSFDKVPKHVVDAFVATEDNRFYEHNGVDPVGIGRAIVKDIATRSMAEGASTITQQLARNVFLSKDKTFMRKTKEMMIALNLERKYSKTQIMEMYLNVFYAGDGVFGVQTASKYYFGKDVSELSLEEGAMLAALPKAPSVYAPTKNPEKALERRNLVLGLMQKNGFITEQQMKEAQAKPIQVVKTEKKKTDKAYQAYIDYLVEEAEDELGISGEELYQGGYKIITYMDKDAQKAMFEEYEKDENFPRDASDGKKVQSAMVIMETKTGGITAMVGGRDYAPKGTHRAKHRFQPGSTIKPLVDYAPALEKGWTPDSIVRDDRTTYKKYNGWTPRNYPGEGYAGGITMRKALVDSRNAAAVWTLNEVGLEKGVDYLKKFSITPEPTEENNLSLALGGMSKGATPIQMAQAYAAFANEGKRPTGHVIKEIQTKDGTVVMKENVETEQIIKPRTAYYMTDMLQDVVNHGTGRAALFGHPLAGKTGTQQYDGVSGANRFAWFVGYTPEYVGAIYMGFDTTDKKHYLKTTGGGAPAKLFSRVMDKAMEGKERKDFERPEGLEPEKQPETVAPAAADLAAVVVEENGKQFVKITWSGSGNNSKYRLYQFLGSPAEKQLIADTAATSFTASFDPNQLYTYVVVPYNADTGEEGSMSNMANTAIPDVPAPQKTDGEQSGDPNAQPVTPADPNQQNSNQETNPVAPNPDGTQPDQNHSGNTEGDQQTQQPGTTESNQEQKPEKDKKEKTDGQGNGRNQPTPGTVNP